MTLERLQRLKPSDAVRFGNLWVGVLSALYAAAFVIQSWPEYGFPNSIAGGVRMILPVPFTPYFYNGVFPISIFMLGIALIAFDHKFGWKALPLVAMTAGAWDLLGHQDILIHYEPLNIGWQLAAALGGWLLAGAPSFDRSSKWFLAVLASFFIFNYLQSATFTLFDYHIFGAACFAFVYSSMKPSSRQDRIRLWLKWRLSKWKLNSLG